jgi:PAS domain-containing protein
VEESTTAQRDVARFCFAGAWTAPVPALVFDSERVLFANAAVLHLLGYSDASSLVGTAFEGVFHPDALLAVVTRRDIVTRTGRPLLGMPTKLLSTSGAPVQQIADVVPLEIADSALTLLTFETQSPDARCRPIVEPDRGAIGPELGLAILEAMAIPLLIQDVDTILFANAAARVLLRASDRSKVEGQPIMSIVHADGLVAAIERVGFVFATHQRLRRVPVKLRALDGHIFHVESDAYPLSEGGAAAALLVGRFLR